MVLHLDRALKKVPSSSEFDGVTFGLRREVDEEEDVIKLFAFKIDWSISYFLLLGEVKSVFYL